MAAAGLESPFKYFNNLSPKNFLQPVNFLRGIL
jgi:hypothetical protein